MIAIIDYGVGNLRSVLNMLRKIGAEARISSKIEELEKASKLILPGVGAFDVGMRNLLETGLVSFLNERALTRKVPCLGICLGMQLLTLRSEEGQLPGLGWVEGETVRFRFPDEQPVLKVPHMGWNTVKPHRDHFLLHNMDAEAQFYFVHSYYVTCRRKEDVLTTTAHGHEFVSMLQRENIFGTQFHPEKSHKHGMQLLRNFVEFA